MKYIFRPHPVLSGGCSKHIFHRVFWEGGSTTFSTQFKGIFTIVLTIQARVHDGMQETHVKAA